MNGGRAGWFGEGSRQLAIYPLDRVAQDGTPLREALLVEYDFAPMLAQTKREAWFYLAQTLTLLLLLGLILNRLYGRLLTRRLARIDQAARQFAIDQQPQNLSVGGRDEIGRLARTLNQMMNQLHERQLALSESEQLFRDLVDTAPIGMLVVDRELRVLQANPAAAALFGCTPAELLGNLPSDRLLESDATTRLLSTPANTPLELTGRRHDREVPLEISCTPFQRYGVRHFLVLLRDISDRLRAEQRLRFLAHFDPLTQLANRNYLVQRRTAARGAPAADAALPRPGPLQAHQRQPRPRDRRQAAGADRRPPGPADARACAPVAQRWRRIHAAARRQRPRPRRAAGPVHHRRLPAAGAHRPVRVLRQPEHRRCHQRRPAQCQRPAQTGGPRPVCGQDAGRNCTVFYNEALSDAAAGRRALEQALRRALDRDEFVLHYQAQVNAQGEPEVMEALLRWNSPERGLVPPGEFIPVLEESGMIIEATRWVVREACRQACRWHAMGHPLRIAINLSPLDFRQADLAGSLLAILAEEGASPDMLELEITESALLEADEHAADPRPSQGRRFATAAR